MSSNEAKIASPSSLPTMTTAFTSHVSNTPLSSTPVYDSRDVHREGKKYVDLQHEDFGFR